MASFLVNWVVYGSHIQQKLILNQLSVLKSIGVGRFLLLWLMLKNFTFTIMVNVKEFYILTFD
jgi:hypothetical protein